MAYTTQAHPYVDYLFSLSSGQQKGAIADLRRGLSDPPAASPAMFPYVAKWVSDADRYTWKEKVYYLVAALFAYYQSGGGQAKNIRRTTGNLGDHCREASQKEQKSKSFEMRFAALLKANDEDLPILLRQMISLLKSADVAVNWDQLFYDLCHWNSQKNFVQHRWSNSYWNYQNNEK